MRPVFRRLDKFPVFAAQRVLGDQGESPPHPHVRGGLRRERGLSLKLATERLNGSVGVPPAGKQVHGVAPSKTQEPPCLPAAPYAARARR